MKFKPQIKWLLFLNRAIIFYLLLFVVLAVSLNQTRTKLKVNLLALNRLMPSFDYLVSFEAGAAPFKASEFDKYVDYYENFVKFVQDRPEAYTMLGFCYYHMGKTKKAISFYEKAIKLDPDYFWPYYNLGLIYFKEGDFAGAVNYLGKAVDISPDYSFKLVRNSKLYRPIQAVSSVNSDFKALKKMKVYYTYSYNLLILSYIQMGNFQKAFEAANFGINSNFGHQDFLHYYAGLANLKMGNPKLAIVYFRECINKNKNYVDAYKGLAQALIAMGEKERAKEVTNATPFLSKENPQDMFDPKLIRLQLF